MQEKKLRDALQAIIAYIESGEIDVFDSYGNLLHIAGMADKALASTTEETEMEKLVAWLGKRVKSYEGRTHPPHNSERRKGMLPTEKELERLIWEKLRPKLTDTGLSIVQAFSGGPIKDAAATIHARLSEGVVWQKTLTVQETGITKAPVLVSDKGYRYYPWWMGVELEVGERIEVTVKIVEGTKDES